MTQKYEAPMNRQEKLAIIRQILTKAKEITDAGYGHVRFTERGDVRYER